MTGRRSRRSATRVDYSKFAGEDGQKGKIYDDGDDEEFELKEGDEKDAVSEDEHMEDIKDEEEEDEEEQIEEVVSTPKRKTSAKPSTARKPRATPARAVKPTTTDSSKPTSRRNGSLIERMSLILGANRLKQIEAINARGTWGNSMFIPVKNDMGKFMPPLDFDSEEIPSDRQVLQEATEA